MTAPAQVAPLPAAQISAYPLELLGLAGLLPNEPYTLTPSVSVSEEWNDNIFLNNVRRQSDFITGVNPGLTLIINQPRLQSTIGASTSSEWYAKETQLNTAFERASFVANLRYLASPSVTLSMFERFFWHKSSNVASQQGFVVRREETWTNTFSPGIGVQITPRTSWDAGVTYGVLRFPGGVGADSDTYGLVTNLNYQFTPFLSGLVGYEFTFLDFPGQEGQESQTHIPRVGGSYRLTRTLTVSASGGPAFTIIGGESVVTPAVAASLVQLFPLGSASLSYTRGINPAGAFGGTNDLETFTATVALTAYRGLVVAATASYNNAKSVSAAQQTNQVDAKTFTAGLSVYYQLNQYVSIFGGYNFLRERTEQGSSINADVDQNRIRVGLQLGYPFGWR